jgi:dTDP-4-dehydrorhamnose reductase
MRALITGGGGLVATALVKHFDDVFALKHAALDITNKAMVDDVIERIHPDVIINTAVIGVDACERDPALAMAINVDGPANLAEAAARTGAGIVHFSSNYVFEGRPAKREPYGVSDEAHPINIYGRTKLAGEHAVAEACAQSFIVRTSWVYGPGKESFLATVTQKLNRGETVQAISDTWASTTYVEDLAARVLEIVRSRAYGTHHVVNDGVCSYETFARRAAELAGIPDEIASRLIEVVSEADMKREAPRPPWTPMRSDPPLRNWEDALADYVTAAR